MSRYTRSPDASVTGVGNRVVLYHQNRRTALVLNPLASWLWRQLADSPTAEQLVRSVCQQYPSVPPEQITHDVEMLLADLVRHSVVSVSS